jgi:hypothetical protein
LEVKTLRLELTLIEKQLTSSVFQDEATWLRMVDIAADVLEHTKLNLTSHAGLRDLLDTTILPALQLGAGLLRAAALKSLGLYCGLDFTGKTAATYFFTFQEALEDDDAAPALQQAAAMAVFDLLLAHANLIEADQEATLLEALYLRMAPDGETELEDCVVQGLSKLLLFGRLGQRSSEELLTKLLILYFDPSTELSPATRQYLSVFFPTLEARKAKSVSLTTCLVPAVRALVHAPKSSTLSKVLPSQLCAFVVSLLMEDQAKSKTEEPATMRLAMDLSLAVLHASDGNLVKVLCQALPMLELTATATNAAQVKALLQEAEDAVGDKVSQKALSKALVGLKKVPEEALEAAGETLAELKEVAFARLDFDAAKYPKLTGKSAPSRKATSRRRQTSSSDEEEDSDEEEAAPKKQPKKASKPKASKPKASKKQQEKDDNEGDDEGDDNEEEEEEEEEEEQAPAPSRRSGRAGTKVSYVEAKEQEFTDSEEEQAEEESADEASGSDQSSP